MARSRAPSRRSRQGPNKRHTALVAALLAGTSVLATLAVGELALRIRHGGLLARPTSGAGPLRMADGKYPAEYDPLLGYAPRRGARGTDNAWRLPVTIDAAGLRENGRPRPTGRPILALGDSFTFGDEVADRDTWPAQLEHLVARPVLNGGVFGYGVDQMVLRGEQLLAGVAADADLVILSLLPEDVLRCEYSYRYAWKPYFALVSDGLALRNVPVPRPHEGPPGESALRRALRWSFVADRSMRLVDPDGWGVPDSLRVHRDGAEVARRLLDRWITGVRRERRALLLVIQWSPYMIEAPFERAVDHARDRGVVVLDLRDVLEPVVRAKGVAAAFRTHATSTGQLGVGHMTPAGNRIAAEAIASTVRALSLGGR